MEDMSQIINSIVTYKLKTRPDLSCQQ